MLLVIGSAAPRAAAVSQHDDALPVVTRRAACPYFSFTRSFSSRSAMSALLSRAGGDGLHIFESMEIWNLRQRLLVATNSVAAGRLVGGWGACAQSVARPRTSRTASGIIGAPHDIRSNRDLPPSLSRVCGCPRPRDGGAGRGRARGDVSGTRLRVHGG